MGGGRLSGGSEVVIKVFCAESSRIGSTKFSNESHCESSCC